MFLSICVFLKICFVFQGDQVFKSVFIIFFQGDQLKTRVKKICEGFRATLYPCPEAPADRREMAMGVMTRIEDLNTVSLFVIYIFFNITISYIFKGARSNSRSPS